MTSEPTHAGEASAEAATAAAPSSDEAAGPRVTDVPDGRSVTTPRAEPVRPLDPGLSGLLPELEWRGMLYARSDGLPSRLATGRAIAGYNGFDPSGPSLHIGTLVPIFGLLHLQRHGGRPVVVVGGGTGMIGDPSGRSAERNLLDRATLGANTAAIRAQLERFLDFTPGPAGAVVVDNLDWLGGLSLLDFLRDVGKHFTIPYMLAKDSVQLRLGAGLSFTEFSYMLLQAYDFLHLFRQLDVELQMGGADQWGNITVGLELIRKVEASSSGGDLAHALCYPLLTNPSGEKFGKTAEGTSVWLDPARTSPFEFYQYWFNAADSDVGQYLRFFTLLGPTDVAELEAAQRERPETRTAQRALAFDLTARVHGPAEAARAREVSEATFDRTLPSKAPEVLAYAASVLPHASLEVAGLSAAQLAVRGGLLGSMGEARRAISQGGLYVNEGRVTDPNAPVAAPVGGRYYVLRHGKRSYRVVVASDAGAAGRPA